MAVSAERVVKGVLGLLGNLSAIGVVLTPVFTTLPEIIAADNVGGRTCFPYAFTWLNAAALVVYAWPRHDWWVLVVNGVAVVVEGVYCYLYIVYARGWNRVIAYVIAVVQLAFVVALLVIQFTFFHDGRNPERREALFGWIVATTAILMYLSPFKETVVAAWTRNVESLTPLLSLAYLVNASIWTGFACIKPFDKYLLIANGTGIASAFLQCLVWLIFRPGQLQIANGSGILSTLVQFLVWLIFRPVQLQIANGSGILSTFVQCLVWLIFRPEHEH